MATPRDLTEAYILELLSEITVVQNYDAALYGIGLMNIVFDEPGPAVVSRYDNRDAYVTPDSFRLHHRDSPNDCVWMVPQPTEPPVHERPAPQMVVRQYVREMAKKSRYIELTQNRTGLFYQLYGRGYRHAK